MAANTDNIGNLTLSVRFGETIRVETPDGDVDVTIVRPHGANGVSLQVRASRDFNIKRLE